MSDENEYTVDCNREGVAALMGYVTGVSSVVIEIGVSGFHLRNARVHDINQDEMVKYFMKWLYDLYTYGGSGLGFDLNSNINSKSQIQDRIRFESLSEFSIARCISIMEMNLL